MMMCGLYLLRNTKKNLEIIPFPIKANDVENKEEQKSAIIKGVW
jgi:hypothetical protein